MAPNEARDKINACDVHKDEKGKLNATRSSFDADTYSSTSSTEVRSFGIWENSLLIVQKVSRCNYLFKKLSPKCGPQCSCRSVHAALNLPKVGAMPLNESRRLRTGCILCKINIWRINSLAQS
eukprot:12431546-Karenia_brevis.AAC.3